jgi:hypothetical protein
MGKRMQMIFQMEDKPADRAEADRFALAEHTALEDIARLAEGSLPPDERKACLQHLNRCPYCYEILKETLTDLSHELPATKAESRVWSRQTLYRLAASVVLLILVGSAVLYQYRRSHPEIITASLVMDSALRAALIENREGVWQGDKAEAIATMLRERGVSVVGLDRVAMAVPYRPSMTKSLCAPREILKVRIEKGVATLEVVNDDAEKRSHESGQP